MATTQKYRLSFRRQNALPNAVNDALSQQFAKADEMFETLFIEARRVAIRLDEGGDGGGAGSVTHTDGPLTEHAVVVGNGADDIAVLPSLGTATEVLHGNATGDPTWGAVNLAVDVIGSLPQSAVIDLITDLASKAPLASPALTGTPTAPTAAAGTNTTQLATTAFVITNMNAVAGSGAVMQYTYSTNVMAPPSIAQVRFNSVTPASITKVWLSAQDDNGRDLYWALKTVPTGATIVVQDKNDHTLYVRLKTTGVPIDNATYFELPVSFISAGGTLNNNQAVLVRITSPE